MNKTLRGILIGFAILIVVTGAFSGGFLVSTA